ncbi:MAG: ATP-binding protein [Myxococcota bacterium]
MNSLFARFYAALGVGHAVGVLVWAAAVAALVPQVAEQHLGAVLDGPTQAMVERLRDVPPNQRQVILDGWSTAPAHLVAPVDVRDTQAVAGGHLAIEVGYRQAWAYRPIDDRTWLALGPLPLVPAGMEVRWTMLALLASLGIGTGAWVALRPVRRTLNRLAEVARAFGQGDLTARARVQGPAELEQVGTAFDAMADRIHALLRAQQETLQGVSHELRTPLTRARFALELVADTDDPVERLAQAEKAAEDLDQMERLLDELLAYLRLEAVRELQPQDTDLRALVASVAEQRVPVEIAGEARAPCEVKLVRRAVRNLVANAARHATSRVVVHLERRDGVASVTVDDDGAGIPAEERPRLLQPFRRGEGARALDPSGVGLGLPIAARVAAAHGGKLEIGDSPLGGARVVLSFPTGEPEPVRRAVV